MFNFLIEYQLQDKSIRLEWFENMYEDGSTFYVNGQFVEKDEYLRVLEIVSGSSRFYSTVRDDCRKK